MTAAAANVLLNFLLIPAYGIVARLGNGAAYAVQAGLGYAFSRRFYPNRVRVGPDRTGLPRGDRGVRRARMLPSVHLAGDLRSTLAPVPDLLLRGGPSSWSSSALAVTRFFHADELRRLRAIRRAAPPWRRRTGPGQHRDGREIVATDIGVPE